MNINVEEVGYDLEDDREENVPEIKREYNNRYKPAQKNFYPRERNNFNNREEFKQHRGVNIFDGVESIHKKTVSAWNQNPSYGNHFSMMSIAFALSLIAQAVLQGCGMIARAIDRTN